MPKIYGIDSDKRVSVEDVREAMVRCFVQAHGPVLEKQLAKEKLSGKELEKRKRIEVEILLRKLFEEEMGSFENPTKESLKRVMLRLRDYSKNFRDQHTIDTHTAEILTLMEKLP
jgi:hypothetical protein